MRRQKVDYCGIEFELEFDDAENVREVYLDGKPFMSSLTPGAVVVITRFAQWDLINEARYNEFEKRQGATE